MEIAQVIKNLIGRVIVVQKSFVRQKIRFFKEISIFEHISNLS
ncbi:hypothetical protein BGP_4122 [Beggiatoa sp. PS]|nr:hypothetical protein BGP_4122 [Beggiatoa sp. PS]